MDNPSDFQRLLACIELEPLDTFLFRGLTPGDRGRRVYGGQVLAQAMNAAARTVEEDRQAHSLHAYFLRPGNPRQPIIYEVDPIRDGRRFSTRRVIARQSGRAIFSTSVSYQIPEDGLEHQTLMPGVPEPMSLDDDLPLRRKMAEKHGEAGFHPIEYRPVEGYDDWPTSEGEARFGVWFRTRERLDDNPGLHQAMVAYMSDNHLMSTALRPHGRRFDNPDLQTASLDHALWFYGPMRADEWLYYDLSSPRSFGGRGSNFGRIYTADGRLIATVAQEGLMRWTDCD